MKNSSLNPDASDAGAPYVPKKSPLLLILVLALFALLVAFSFYLGLQKSAIEAERASLTGEIEQLNTEIRGLEGARLQAARSAQAWLEKIQKEEILWSNVIIRIGSLLPFDSVSQAKKIRFLSYSGGQGGKLSLSAKTRALDSDPYPDVAELIEVFNASSYFLNAYVPSVTRGEDDQGKNVITFLFNVTYQEEVPETSSTQTADGAEADTSEQPKVPRQ